MRSHADARPAAPLQRLPLSLPELVQAAPSLTADGSLIVGRRESRVYVLDRATGTPLATLTSDSTDQAGQLAWAGERSAPMPAARLCTSRPSNLCTGGAG